MTLEEFILLRDFIYEKTGIFFEEKKLYFLETRVAHRVVDTNSSSAKEYYRFLKYEKNDDELTKLINLITINETYFFRDTTQMNAFADELMPLMLARKRSENSKELKIWSAACSTGDEPYSIAILLKERLPDFCDWKIEILASDIDTDALKKCVDGVYASRALKDVPPHILNKYFKPAGADYVINDDIKRMVAFKRVNLFDSHVIRKIKNVDILFCRNVLIYFNDKSKKQVINDFFDILNKKGIVLLGVGESLGRISASFKLLKLKNALVYEK